MKLARFFGGLFVISIPSCKNEVHIADVTNFVKPGSPLDREAQNICGWIMSLHEGPSSIIKL